MSESWEELMFNTWLLDMIGRRIDNYGFENFSDTVDGSEIRLTS